MEANWKPLEIQVGRARCVGFMFMGRVNGINLYKHGIARTYLNLDDAGNCFVHCGKGIFEAADFSEELRKLEAALREQGETLATPYDDAYIARKTRALERAGIPILRIKLEPEEIIVN
jgi:hypothetical protein